MPPSPNIWIARSSRTCAKTATPGRVLPPACCRTAPRCAATAARSSITPTPRCGRCSSDCATPTKSIRVMVRACATPIRSPAAGRRRSWGRICRCCRKALKESLIVRPTAPSLPVSKARARPGSTARIISWKSGDVFVVPSWKSYSHSVSGEAVLFGISDRPAQEALGIWRED